MLEILYEVGKVLLTLYLYFISYFYTLSVPLSWTTPVRLIGIYVCVQLVCKWIRKIKIEIKVESDKKNWKFGLAMFGLTFIVMGIYCLQTHLTNGIRLKKDIMLTGILRSIHFYS